MMAATVKREKMSNFKGQGGEDGSINFSLSSLGCWGGRE